MQEENKTKSKPGLKKWVVRRYYWNILSVEINVLILTGLIFWLVGAGLNTLVVTLTSFFLMFIPMVTVMLLVNVIIDSQLAFVEGKWEIKDDEATKIDGKYMNPWRRVALEALILGTGIALIICIPFWVSGVSAFPFSPVMALVFPGLIIVIPTYILSTLLIKRHLPNALKSFTAALPSSKQNQPEPFMRYFLWEHIIPWASVLAILNLGINLKGFYEKELITGGGVLIGDVIYSVVLTAVVIVLWMWVSAVNQVRSDVHLGRVAQGRKLSVSILLLMLSLTPILAGIVVWIPLLIGGITHLPVILSTIIIIMTAVVTAVIGRGLGIWWGKTSEFKKIGSE